MKFIPTRSATRVMKNLPSDVLMDILSRLPSELIQRCRKLSVPLQALISSVSFVDIHLTRVEQSWEFAHAYVTGPYKFGAHKHELKLSVDLTDPCSWKTVSRKLYVNVRNLEFERSYVIFRIQGSCSGFLLFNNPVRCIVWNPITEEHKIVEKQELNDEIHSLYFDPKTREYKILFWRFKDKTVQYFVYSLRTNSWRLLKHTMIYQPIWSPPITINGVIHSLGMMPHECFDPLVKDDDAWPLLSFHIDSQVWETIPIPTSIRRVARDLKEFEGGLCLCDHDLQNGFQVWVLEDYAKGIWVERYSINLEDASRNFPWGSKWVSMWAEDASIVMVGNDHFVVISKNYYFTYNTKLSIWRKLAKSKGENEIVLHTNTVVSMLK